MKGWRNLGVVETIYEEEQEELSNSSPAPPTNTTSISSLQTIVASWSKATGVETDVVVRVHGRCFHLHKDPVIARCRYLKRLLTESNDITVSLPSKITAEEFALAACFCYGSDVVITPFNVITLRVLVELLEMTDGNGTVDANLRRKTETYFCQAVAVNREYAAIILRTCLALLPEAEQTAFLVSRCIEALVSTDGVCNGTADGWVDDVIALTAEEFQIIADSMKGRFASCHDLLYRIVDIYLKEYTGNLTEEQKIRICTAVDCNKLSQHLLMHAVQNPIMPLRFVIRAMLVEQLNTRRSIFSATSITHAPKPHDECITLGAILHRDAALRHVAQLKASMDATGERIISLENDLMHMRKQLHESEKKRKALESTRSASFRFSWEDKKERGMLPSPMDKSCRSTNPRNSKSLSKILISGLKNMFRTSKPDSESGCSSGGDEDVGVEERPPSHCRNHSSA